MIAAILLLAASPAAPLTLDHLTPAERAAAVADSENDTVVRAIDSLARCLPRAKDPSSCGGNTDCGTMSMPSCTYVDFEAWDAYADHYLALLKADPTVRAAAIEAQKLWAQSRAADCALSDAITDRRELPYRSYWSNQCLLEKTTSRAIALRDQVITLYGDADMQGGIPYPGKAPVIVPK
jgi:uncharacterized protein YecT (DUF1311 family)